MRAGGLRCAALRACFAVFMPVAFISAHFLEPHVRFVVRTRVMCPPLWVVVHVCALLRAY